MIVVTPPSTLLFWNKISTCIVPLTILLVSPLDEAGSTVNKFCTTGLEEIVSPLEEIVRTLLIDGVLPVNGVLVDVHDVDVEHTVTVIVSSLPVVSAVVADAAPALIRNIVMAAPRSF